VAYWWHFVSIPLYKIPFNDVVKGRVGCNILFSTPLWILGESPSQSVRGSKMFFVTYWSLAFLNSRMSNNIENRPPRCASDRRSAFFPNGRDGRTYLRTQSNLRTSLPCTTSLVVAGSKAYRNDQLWKTSVESHLVKHTYIHTCIHTYIHTYIHTHIHTIFHPTFRLHPPYIHTYIHKWTSCMAFILWNLNSPWKVDTEKLSIEFRHCHSWNEYNSQGKN